MNCQARDFQAVTGPSVLAEICWRSMTRFLLLGLMLLAPTVASAAEIPRYDIQKYCSDPTTDLSNYVQATPAGCINVEKEKLTEIQAEWIVYKPEFLARCIDAPGIENYSALAACLADMPTSADID